MEFQFHPASRRGAVRSVVLDPRGEKVAIALAGLASLAALSLWITVPTVVRREARDARSDGLAREVAASRRDQADLAARAAALRERALEAGDLISRAAFLYGVAPVRWPRSLSAEAGVLEGTDPARIATGLTRYLGALERGYTQLVQFEAKDPAAASRRPSRIPILSDLVEPSATFGPRVSPWTGAEEFFVGLDLAAPAGSPVVAPADATVLFAGRVPASRTSRRWRFGNLVVLAHGEGGATLFGHLGRIDVRRGERVRRGQRLGAVGATGWAMSPVLHYEYWRPRDGKLSPTDPRFAILDRRLVPQHVSLEQMDATSAPEPVDPLPGG